jgi:hypothetical protein
VGSGDCHGCGFCLLIADLIAPVTLEDVAQR